MKSTAMFTSFGIPAPDLNGDSGASSLDEGDIERERRDLIMLQIKAPYVQVREGFMALLEQRLLSEGTAGSFAAICGYANHFQQMESYDFSWGCGWRNIQILSSFLLVQRADAKEVLFGGSTFVPEIFPLQRWLELAWARGFDVAGGEWFNWKIAGTPKWIGATECAALFRSFGLRAQIMEFKYTQHKGTQNLAHPIQKRNSNQTSGSSQEPTQTSGQDMYRGVYHSHEGNYRRKEQVKHKLLVDWIWEYFTREHRACLSSAVNQPINRVVISNQSPLYFQHRGHSCIIVGIQQCRYPECTQIERFLLVLDPSQKTEDLSRSLRDGIGWQKYVKRDVHTLNKLEYQLCYVDPGVAYGEELERLKLLRSMLFFY